MDRTTSKNNSPASKIPPPLFLVVTILSVAVAVLTSVQLKCPTCLGSGIIQQAQGLTAEVASYRLQTCAHEDGWCTSPTVWFTYEVTISLKNDGITPISGHLVLSYYDPKGDPTAEAEKAIFEESIKVDVPACTTTSVVQLSHFEQEADCVPEAPLHRMVMNTGEEISEKTAELPCIQCKGKGTLPFFEWSAVGTK